MKRPENFEKIDGTTINVEGERVKIDLSNVNDNIFLFQNGHGNNWNNCILLEMDYPKNEYNIKICNIGMGDEGWYLNRECDLSVKDFQTIDTFTNWLSKTIKTIAEMTNLERVEQNYSTTIIRDTLPIVHSVTSSDGTKTYQVTDCNDGTGIWTCSCKAFVYSKQNPPTCKHIQLIKN